MQYPKATSEDVIETINGQVVRDPYRWLENDHSPDVQDWVEAENKLAESQLEGDPNFAIYREEIANLQAIHGHSVPSLRHDSIFYIETLPNQDHGVLKMKPRHGGEARVLIDPNDLQQTNGYPTALYFWSVSKSGRYLSYGLIERGVEMTDLMVIDLDDDEKVVARLPRHKGAGAWLPDESGFYHVQYPVPADVPVGEEQYHSRVYFHLLGSDPANDKVIFGEDMPKEAHFNRSISRDGRYIAISVSVGWRRNDLYLASTTDHVFRPFITGLDAKAGVTLLEDQIILSTNYLADRWRLLSAQYDSIPNSIDDWDELVPESKDVLSNFGITEKYLILGYLHDVCSKLFVYRHDGSFIKELELPPYSVISNMGTNSDEAEFYLSLHSFLNSMTIYHFDPESLEIGIWRQPQRQLNADKYQVEQVWYPSRDGTEIPMFVISQKNLERDGSARAVLYGYGGFGLNQTPGFPTNWMQWLERGGVYAIANIRGGGEFGTQWHQGAIRKHKQIGFDDFIAAAEHLVAEGYTAPSKLAIVGGSNGGLLVGAVMVQRPDLFGAVVCKVPLLDMVRFPKFLVASRWVEEYGDPTDATELGVILKWSPYHNINPDFSYPAVLFEASENDTRVAPLHARKMAALMQSLGGVEPVYCYTRKEHGHGPGRGRSQFAIAQAMVLCFLDQSLA